MQKNIANRLILPIFAILTALGVAGFFIPLKGEWVDRVVSETLSRRLKLEVKCFNSKLVRWSEVSFDKMTAGVETAKPLLQSGTGEIYLYTKPFLIFHLNDISLTHNIGASGFLSSLPISKSLEGETMIRRVTAGLSGRGAEGFLHFFECDSDDFKLKGGVKWGSGRVIKAHFYLWLSPEKSKKLPKEILRSMISKEGGWVALKAVYNQNEFTLLGAHGPMFRAKWAGIA